MNIEYKQFEPTLTASTRLVVHKRTEIHEMLGKLAKEIPAGQISGPPFCIFNFITSVKEGYDVTLGFPVTMEIESENLKPLMLPEFEVLAYVHRDAPETPVDFRSQIFQFASENGIVSDEFYREVYLDDSFPGGPGIEFHFVIHNWNKKLANGVRRVLGAEARSAIMAGSENLEVETGLEARFDWVKGMLARLDGVADEHQKWDILSGCAHVFPQGQIAKLTAVFDETKTRTRDPLQAVDAVIAFMESDSGWVEGGLRDGYTITVAKQPRDKKAYAEAQTDLERRQAYCFCPMVRTKMDQGMPVDFCNCGSGWFRQQWEGATGKPVKIDIVQSVLRGDEKCEFTVHLATDI